MSVVVAFKDWGVERLLVAVRYLVDAVEPVGGEVIVSDYGSAAGPVLRTAVEDTGARYIYTGTDGVWSRSRALNAGFAVARGQVFISTDADMLFSPASIGRIVDAVQTSPPRAVVLQCRDLPEGYSEAEVAGGVRWEHLDSIARIRPRWGMGGMMAVPRSTFETIRGFDERMQIYGGEDLDFAHRVRRSGLRIHWIEQPEVRMYHMWHPPTRGEVSQTPEGRAAIDYNRSIVLSDRSVVRNLPQWRHAPAGRGPLVSVVIATRDRAELLGDSIRSVLAQTFQDFELLIVDDGSVDATREVVASFGDPRVQYVFQERAGVAAARNRASTIASGQYVAVHDDDDLMLPWRLEASIRAIDEEAQGSYGGWVDFQEADGSLTAHNGREFSLAALLYSHKVYAHATLLISTDVLRRISYNTSLTSGSDYNLALRLARSGVCLRHTGEFHLLRRLHGRQVTVADSARQGQSARLTVAMVEGQLGAQHIADLRKTARSVHWAQVHGSDRVEDLVAPYLPDAFVERNLLVTGTDRVAEPTRAELADRMGGHEVTESTGRHGLFVPRATWDDLVWLGSQGLMASTTAVRARHGDERDLIALIGGGDSAYWVSSGPGSAAPDDLPHARSLRVADEDGAEAAVLTEYGTPQHAMAALRWHHGQARAARLHAPLSIHDEYLRQLLSYEGA